MPTGRQRHPPTSPIPAFLKGKECTTTSSNTTGMNFLPLGRAGEGLPINSCFCTANGGLFFTAKGRFFYRRGGCRHAVHDGGDGGDGKEENSFSDCRHRHPHQGEADSHRHGFLYLYQPIIEVSINGFTPHSALRKQQQLCRRCVSPAQGCGRSTLPWVSAPLIWQLYRSCD